MGPLCFFRSFPSPAGALLLCLLSGCDGAAQPAPSPPGDAAALAAGILAAAKAEAAKGAPYVEEYHVLKYPGGDVPEGTGVCTDLVIRALRPVGLDLQKAVHEDRKAHPKEYPTSLWDNRKADRNIDHRRCPNLVAWLRRHAESLPVGIDAPSLKAHWRPGDIVFYGRPGGPRPWHTGIVSDRQDADGMPRILDSYPPAASESHRLDAFLPIHSHFRLTRLPKAPRQP